MINHGFLNIYKEIKMLLAIFNNKFVKLIYII